MTGTQTAEVRRNTGKDILVYITLAAIAVLSVVIYLWISFSPLKKQAEERRPWDLVITSALPPEEDDLQTICALDSVERVERSGEASLSVWIAGSLSDQKSYEDALSKAEGDLAGFSAQKEAARIAELQAAQAEKAQIAAELAELDESQRKLGEQAQKLAELRQELDEKGDSLREWGRMLSSIRNELNRDGQALGEEEVQLSAGDSTPASYRENARLYREQREAWYAGGEDYLDTQARFEQDRQALEREEQLYTAEFAAWETERERLDLARKALEEQLSRFSETPETEDCAWQIRRNPDGWTDPAAGEKTFSPLRLAMQTLFLSAAALSAWLFFAKLLSSAAGTITRPKQPLAETTEI